MRDWIKIISLIIFIGIVSVCSSPQNQNVKDATYVHEGDTINPLEGSSEGTAGNKYMESANNADSTEEVQQDLEFD